MTEETAAVFTVAPLILSAVATLLVYIVCRALDARGKL